MRLPRVSSFRDVNPYLVGIVSTLIIGALVGFAFMVGILRLFEDTYSVDAVFSDAGGMRAGDEVRVAGVKAGRVDSLEVDRDNGRVVVTLVVNKGVQLGPETTAEIALATLLGSRYVRLDGDVQEPFLSDMPRDERVIPLERTKTPFDIFELTRIGTRSVQQTDTENLNRFINDLADITEGKRETITDLVQGVDTVATALNEREAQLKQLLDRADQLTATLAEKDETLVALIDQSRAILQLMSDRRDDIARSIQSGDAALGEVARLLDVNRANLHAIVASLEPTIEVVDRRQADLDRVLAIAGPAFLGQAKAGSHGPWADIYIRAMGPDVIQVLHDAVAVAAPGEGGEQ